MAEITWEEFIGWLAYYRLEPWDEDRADWRMAQLCTLVANALRGKSGRRAKVKDFMWESCAEDRQQTPEDHRRLFGAIAAATGGNRGNDGEKP